MDQLLRPREPVAPPLAPPPDSAARVSIGRVRVEVIADRSAQAPPAPRVVTRRPPRVSSLGPTASKLRFGLGQV